MADLILPFDHPIAKSLRGWPSSPNVKPNVSLEIDWGNPITRGLTQVQFPKDLKFYDLTKNQIQGEIGSPIYSQDYVYLYNTAIKGESSVGAIDNDVTVFAKIKFIASRYYQMFCSSGSQGFELRELSTSKQIQFISHISGAEKSATSSGTVSTGDIVNIAGSHSSSGIRVYIDGTLAGSGAGGSGGFTSLNATETCFGQRAGGGSPTDVNLYFGLIFNRQLSDAEIASLDADPFQVLRPANQSPFLISVPAGGGASYAETYATSASASLALADGWSLAYSEAYATSAASSLALSESYATGYAETYAASASAALALTDAWLLDFAETYGANASCDLALTDSWSLDYSEAYAVGAAADLALADSWALDYAETLTVTATGDLALSNAYAVGNNYNETFSVAAVADLSLNDVWAPHYGETLASDATAALALTDTWQLDYAETLAASAAAALLLSDAYDSPAPGAYDETFSASAIAALDLTHLFTTPNALPPGINHLTARRVGGFFAVKP